jgi:hypothetical protein
MIHPGAYDVWYDGVDQDCSGNDDFDQDQDGHDAADYGGDDCDDLDAYRNPEVAESPYDGVDNDCDPLTLDEDLDGDGFDHLTDCDDTAPDAYPGAPELLDDGVDQDCDGEIDQAEWGFADLTFLDPQRPILAVTDDYVVLGALALEAEQTSWPELEAYVSPGLLLTFDASAVNGAPFAQDPVAWYGAVDVDPVPVFDLAARGSEVVFGTTYYSSVNDYGYQAARPLSWLGPGIGWFPSPASYYDRVLTSWNLVDLRLDGDGSPWLCATSADQLAYMRGDGTPGSPGAALDGVDGTRGCVWTAPEQVTTIAADGLATTWDVDPAAVAPPTLSADQPFATGNWFGGREKDGVALLISTTAGFDTLDGSGGRTHWYDQYAFTDADLAVDGSDAWVAGIVNRGNGNEVLLAGGGADRFFGVKQGTRILNPVGVAVALTPDRVILAVSAYDVTGSGRDLIGWAFYPR